mmetsp:Transcript_29912/g.56419  ORF Transcript_29912/g.56419 Transcript_29912/m.56419 type:complete len:267 (+) Transcript_29912:2444-3244(+)
MMSDFYSSISQSPVPCWLTSHRCIDEASWDAYAFTHTCSCCKTAVFTWRGFSFMSVPKATGIRIPQLLNNALREQLHSYPAMPYTRHLMVAYRMKTVCGFQSDQPLHKKLSGPFEFAVYIPKVTLLHPSRKKLYLCRRIVELAQDCVHFVRKIMCKTHHRGEESNTSAMYSAAACICSLPVSVNDHVMSYLFPGLDWILPLVSKTLSPWRTKMYRLCNRHGSTTRASALSGCTIGADKANAADPSSTPRRLATAALFIRCSQDRSP